MNVTPGASVLTRERFAAGLVAAVVTPLNQKAFGHAFNDLKAIAIRDEDFCTAENYEM